MTHRTGECSSCGAKYKLPASFAADRARCKSCGGVVEIGPAEAAKAKASPPVPASKPTGPVPIEKKKKKREGPSMKERLLAERKAQEEAATAKKTAKPVRKSTAKVIEEEEVEEIPATKSRRRSTRAGGSTRSSRSASSRQRDGEGEDEDSGSTRRRARGSRRQQKKAPMLPFLVATVLFAFGGVGLWWVLTREEVVEEPVTTEEEVVDVVDTPVELTEEEIAAAAAAEEEAALKAEQEAATKAAEKAAAKAAKEAIRGDPASIDLMAIPDYGPIEGCDEDRFLQLKQWAADMVDPMAGAAGNRARNKLIEAGKEAFPVILNAMKRLDLTDDDGFRSADVSQRALMDICNGRNLDWYYPDQDPEEYHFKDKQIIQFWCKLWDKAVGDEEYWLEITKQKGAEAEGQPAEETQKEDAAATEEELEELDELDDL